MPGEIGSIPGLDLVREKLVSGFQHRDYPALGALFAANAVLLPPGRPIINNGDAVREFWASIGERVKAIALEPVGVRPLGGDAAREVGRIRMSVGDQSQTVLNKYLLLWQRTADNWLIESFVWNRVRLVQGGGRLRPNREGGQNRRQTIQDLYEG